MRTSLSSCNVLRRLPFSNGRISPATALSGLSVAPSPRSIRTCRAPVHHSSRRTFLNFLRAKPPREVKHVGFEPGFDTFLAFRANLLTGVKPPSNKDLLQAVRVFFDHKLLQRKAVNPTQALVARQVIEHLLSNDPCNRSSEKGAPDGTEPEDSEPPQSLPGRHKEPQGTQPILLKNDLQKALRALSPRYRQKPSEDVAQLAKVIYIVLKQSFLQDKKVTESQIKFAELFDEDLLILVKILTLNSQTTQAAELVSRFKEIQDEDYKSDGTRDQTSVVKDRLLHLHLLVLRGYTRESDFYSARLYANMLCEAGFPYNTRFQHAMTSMFATMGDDGEEELRQWFEKPLTNALTSSMPKSENLASVKAYLQLVNFSFETGRQPQWIKTALQELCNKNPPKAWWKVIFEWAVWQGKDISHIRTMIDIVTRLNTEEDGAVVDIFTINYMLKAANAKKEPLLAERINSLVSEQGLRANGQTRVLVLQARVAGNDSLGSASIFDEILHNSAKLGGHEVTGVLNQYIRFLCSTSTSANIIEALSRVEARRGELEPETVVDVCLAFLKDDKTMEVIDTLGLHLSQFSMDERRIVRTSVLQYCVDMDISTARAWDAYSILRQYWPETTREERTRLMQAFFSRKRPDMACHVFGHMRAHPDDSLRPDLDVYVICLENMGSFPDSDSLALIHNMFKMDALIQPSTRLYNAFMIAFIGCNAPRKAFEFWRQIANSKEGPTYKSLELVFRACEKLPGGYDRARGIWDKMQGLEVDVPASVYDAFTLMVAGQAGLEKAKSMLVARVAEYGEEPSQAFLTRIYNALPDSHLQEAYQQWASLEYPEKWQKTQKLRRTVTLQATERILMPPERFKAD